VAIFTFDSTFDGMPNMSAISSVAIEDIGFDNTQPSAPGNPQGQVSYPPENSIQLTWTAVTDAESGVSKYIVKQGRQLFPLSPV
jgi:hypothetical protein